MSEHKSDGKREHAARVKHHLSTGGCSRYARGGGVQENEKSFDKEVKEETGKSRKAAKPEFRKGGKASGKKPHHRLDKHARGGAVKMAKGGKAKDAGKGNKINIVVAPHPQPGAAPGGLAGGPPMPPPRPPMPPMAAPPPGANAGPGMAPSGPGGPQTMPMRPMKSGGAARPFSQSKKVDLGSQSESQASNEDVDINPPKRKFGGVIEGMKRGGARHAVRHPKTGKFMKGGKVEMDYGAGSGLGRLQKAKEYGARPTK